MRSKWERRVLRYAVGSRAVVVSLIIMWRSILSPYDTSAASIDDPPCLWESNPAVPPVLLLPGVGSAIESSIVWEESTSYASPAADTNTNTHTPFCLCSPSAFPFSPIQVVFRPLVPLIGYRAVLGLSAYLLNNVAFVFASLYLYWLSLIVFKDRDVAFRAAILFCFNPTSIFYSSIYSESLYALLSFGGLYYFVNGAGFFATFWLALSGFARSNGVLNAGYICFLSMQQVNEAFVSRRRSYYADLYACQLLMMKTLLAGALCSICIFTPFISFQAYGYFNICMGRSVAEMRPWCKARLPLLYNYIQSHYWGVGFLRYFQFKQLPNFLLASPILSLAIYSIVYYVIQWPEVCWSLGLRASPIEHPGSSSSTRADGQLSTAGFSENVNTNVSKDDWTLGLRKRAIRREDLVIQPSKSKPTDSLQCDPVVILPFVLHLSFMVATAFFVMHVQVATRFLSASPILYWFGSHSMGSNRGGKRLGHFIWAYCSAYLFLGTLLFSNFYPFT